MLKTHRLRGARSAERGMVLVVALIVLVAITLAGMAMLRSVDTATLVAGNLAFQQAATQASDRGVEDALTMLRTKSGEATLDANDTSNGYYASIDPTTDNPGAANPTWQQLWQSKWNANAKDLGTDSFDGNHVWYVVHRECANPGPPGGGSAFCVASPAVTTTFIDPNSGGIPLTGVSQIYYRVTVRVAGPRRTESYVQVHVAM